MACYAARMAIERFRNKATGVIVEAVQLSAPMNIDEIESFTGGDAEWRSGALVVATRQGALWLGYRGWVVKDADDLSHFHARPPDSFLSELFERVPPVVSDAA